MYHIQTLEWFWSIIKKADCNREKLKEILSAFKKERHYQISVKLCGCLQLNCKITIY